MCASFLHLEQRGLFSLYFAWMGIMFYLVNGLDVHKNSLCEWSGTHHFYPCSLLASFMKQIFLSRYQIYMRNLQESPPSPASMNAAHRRALPFLNKGTLMQNCLSPPKGTVFQGHTKRKALSICLAQQTRLTRQLRNRPRCLLASSV